MAVKSWKKKLLKKVRKLARLVGLRRSEASKLAIPRGAHKESLEFWRRSKWTFLAAGDYYDRQETAIRSEILPLIGRPEAALDVGCGNGRFTFALAEHASQVTAVDISPHLIAEATAEAGNRDAGNVSFRVADVLAEPPAGIFDLVSCMGVTSVIIDHKPYQQLLRALTGAVKPGGYLLMKDTLSTTRQGEYLHTGRRPTIYRSEKQYLDDLAKLGVVLRHTVRLKNRPKRRRRNSLFLFQKVA